MSFSLLKSVFFSVAVALIAAAPLTSASSLQETAIQTDILVMQGKRHLTEDKSGREAFNIPEKNIQTDALVFSGQRKPHP